MRGPLAIAGLIVAVGAACAESAPAATPTPEPLITATEERAVGVMVRAYMRLALEYGIKVDEEALREEFEEVARETDIYEDSMLGTVSIWLHGWFFDDADAADVLKQSILDEGESPVVYLQRMADRLEARSP